MPGHLRLRGKEKKKGVDARHKAAHDEPRSTAGVRDRG
jgi:hypothetical protein